MVVDKVTAGIQSGVRGNMTWIVMLSIQICFEAFEIAWSFLVIRCPRRDEMRCSCGRRKLASLLYRVHQNGSADNKSRDENESMDLMKVGLDELDADIKTPGQS